MQVMPSTSPAAARMRYPEKLAAYRAALTHVETLEDVRRLAKDMKRDLK